MRKTTSTQEYFESMSDLPLKATNETEHKGILLDSEKDERKIQELSGRDFLMKYSQLIDKDIQTGNIGTDQFAYFAIQEAEILTHVLDMASREPSIRPPFILMYNQFRNGILITKAKNGKWADKQYQTGGQNPIPQGGYGADPIMTNPNQEQQNSNPIKQFMAGFKSGKE